MESVTMNNLTKLISINPENVLSQTKQGLVEQGLMGYIIEDIMIELEKQSYNVQATFYYRMQGLTVEQVGSILNVHKSTVSREYLSKSLNKIEKILKNYATK
jgi:DNA-directed RNA polymerase specialized sigma subunit